MLDTYVRHRDAFFKKQMTAQFLGKTTGRCYKLVRETLGVPFNRGLVEQPGVSDTELDGRPKKIIGSWVSTIYEALRDGRLIDVILREEKETNGNHVTVNGDGEDSDDLGSFSPTARKEVAVAKAEEEILN